MSIDQAGVEFLVEVVYFFLGWYVYIRVLAECFCEPGGAGFDRTDAKEVYFELVHLAECGSCFCVHVASDAFSDVVELFCGDLSEQILECFCFFVFDCFRGDVELLFEVIECFFCSA